SARSAGSASRRYRRTGSGPRSRSRARRSRVRRGRACTAPFPDRLRRTWARGGGAPQNSAFLMGAHVKVPVNCASVARSLERPQEDRMGARFWLIKSEPAAYSWDDLVKDGETLWDGVRNHRAAMNLRAMAKGDRAFFYHSVTG